MAKSQTDAAHLIRSRRILLGLSQARLAEMVACTPTAIRRWERGELAPPEDVIDELAEALEIDASELRPPPPPKPATVVVSSPLTPPPPPRATASEPAAVPTQPAAPPAPRAAPPQAVPPKPPVSSPLPSPVPTESYGAGTEDDGEPWIHFATDTGEHDFDLAEPSRPAAASTGAAVPPGAPAPAAPAAGPTSMPEVPPAPAAPRPPADVPAPGPDDTAVVAPPRRPVALLQQRAAAPAPVQPTSYLDKPSERIIYALRLILTIVALAIMAWLVVWAIGELLGALDEAIDFFSETTLVDTGLDLPAPPGATG